VIAHLFYTFLKNVTGMKMNASATGALWERYASKDYLNTQAAASTANASSSAGQTKASN
jgi:hypothetical protein